MPAAVKLLFTVSKLSEQTVPVKIRISDSLNEVNHHLTAEGLQFKFSVDGEGNYGFLGADGSLIPFRKGLSGDVITHTTYAEGLSEVSIAFEKNVKAICISGTIQSARNNLNGVPITATAVTESGTLYNNTLTSIAQYVTSGLSYYSSGNILFIFTDAPTNSGTCKITVSTHMYGITASCLY